MSGIGTGYDLSTTTYSPDGKVFQIEYAQKAVDNAGTAIGLRCRDGVVVACERLVQSKMLVAGSQRAVYPVDLHAGLVVTGLAPDGRQIADRAQAECRQWKEFYGSEISGKVLSDRLGAFMHIYTLAWYLRPIGASSLLAVYGRDGPELYVVEPSGTAYRFFGAVAGKGKQAAKTEIERLNLKEITCREAVREICKILRGLREEEKAYEIEMGWVCDETNRRFQRVPKELVDEADAAAKAALDSDMEDD